jgi:hypothetical protein
MADINSTLSQLIFAFKTHGKNSRTKEDISHWLLLFYCVECGLKAKYLKGFNGLTTDDFESLPIKKKYGHGHDLSAWIKELKIPNVGYIDDKNNRPIVRMHERLRYGTFTSASLEQSQINFLKAMLNHLSKQL